MNTRSPSIAPSRSACSLRNRYRPSPDGSLGFSPARAQEIASRRLSRSKRRLSLASRALRSHLCSRAAMADQLEVARGEPVSPHNEALYDAGKAILVETIEVGRDFCRYMIGIATGAI